MTQVQQAPCFGPAGNSERFYEEGNKRTVQTFAWQRAMGLTAFEYPFGRGIRLGEDAAREIGEAAKEAGVVISAHAPYYINLASAEEDAREKSIDYILRSAQALTLMGGTRLVVHPGAPRKLRREQALQNCMDGMVQARARLVEAGMPHIQLCPETMGRPSVIGTLAETLALVRLDDSFVPCIDFAHLHAANSGCMRSEKDFAAVLDTLESTLGEARAKQLHAHFSAIEYGPKGELKHRIFADEGFGPDFAHLAPLLKQRGYGGVFICESRGTMADDAATMLRLWQEA